MRTLPGVLGDPKSLNEESFSGDLLEYPQYTQPRDWNGIEVPEVLLSGNHAEIKKLAFRTIKEYNTAPKTRLVAKIY